MTIEGFERARKKVFREHRHTIVRSALKGYERKGEDWSLWSLLTKEEYDIFSI